MPSSRSKRSNKTVLLDQQIKPLIAVLGAGSWGSALALVLARNGFPVILWARQASSAQAIQQANCNDAYLPSHIFPNNLQVTACLSQALTGAQVVLVAVPSIAFRPLLIAIKPLLQTNARLVWATKGLDSQAHVLFHTVVSRILAPTVPMAVLSGPSFAEEVAKGLPTAVVVASNEAAFASDLQTYFSNDYFRVYTSTDLIGVQLGGAIKNVIAIATGIADGLGFGANARSALITRGLAEMVRLGDAMGAEKATFMGLSGVGDLVLTCTDNQSRNRRFGLALGQGLDQAGAILQVGKVVEGVFAAEQITHLAQCAHVDMPIVTQVHALLQGKVSPHAAVAKLLSRPLRTETS